MTTLIEIKQAIISGQFSNDELGSIGDAIRFARSQLTQQNRRSLTIGTKVKFTNSRTGVDVTGTVDKVAIKFVTVRSTSGLWKVPANMLSAA
jgi:hypothetical protein